MAVTVFVFWLRRMTVSPDRTCWVVHLSSNSRLVTPDGLACLVRRTRVRIEVLMLY